MSHSFIHLSDLHFGAHRPELADVLLEQLHELAPDLVIASGDFTYHARRREFAAARAWLDRLPCPWHAVPGNHDSPAMNHPWQRLVSPFARYRDILGRELEEERQWPGLAVLGLNSARPIQPRLDWSQGGLDQRQLVRLEAWSRRVGDGPLKVVSLHHPLARPAGNERVLLRPAEQIRAALARAKVDLVVSGHFHQPLVAPLATEGFQPLISLASTAISHRLKGEPNGFQRLRHDPRRPDDLVIEGWIWDDDRFRPRRRVDAQRRADGWHLSAEPCLEPRAAAIAAEGTAPRR